MKTIYVPPELYAIRDREIARGQQARIIFDENKVLRVECVPGYRILADRRRNGTTAIMEPHWPYDAESGVEYVRASVQVMTGCKYHTNFRAERRDPEAIMK